MKNKHPEANKQATDTAPMEQVREILFGAQLKDMEARFKRQEERLLREINDSKDSMKKRLDSLENFMKSESSSLLEKLIREQDERETIQRAEQKDRTDALASEQRERHEAIKIEQKERSEAIKAEEKERQEAINKLNHELNTINENLERRLNKLSNSLDSSERALRSLMLSESGSLTDKIENKYSDALSVISKTASQIRSDMVYRTAISGMFAELIGGLSRPWNDENMEPSSSSPLNFEDAGEKTPPTETQADENDAQLDENQIPKLVSVGSADSY